MKLPLVALAALAALSPASARDNGQWTGNTEQVQQWFRGLMQPDNPVMSCCGEADAYEADTFEVDGDHYVAVITDGRGGIANGTRVIVTNNKMKWDAGNPTGHGIIFLGAPMNASGIRSLYCYVAPGGV